MQTILQKWQSKFGTDAPQTSRANTSNGVTLSFNPARGVDATPDDDPISQYKWGGTTRYDNSWGLYGSFGNGAVTEEDQQKGITDNTTVNTFTLFESGNEPLWYIRQKFRNNTEAGTVELYKSRGFSTVRAEPDSTTNFRIIGYENSATYSYTNISANHNRFRQATYDAITTNETRDTGSARSFYD